MHDTVWNSPGLVQKTTQHISNNVLNFKDIKSEANKTNASSAKVKRRKPAARTFLQGDTPSAQQRMRRSDQGEAP